MKPAVALASVATSLALVSTAAAAPAPATTASTNVTPKQICAAVQSATLASAIASLAKLLPPRYQPSKTLKTVVTAVAGACPIWAPTAVKVGQAVVRRTAPGPTVYVSAPLTSLMATRTMNVQTGAASVFVSWVGVGLSGYQEQTYAGGSWDRPLVVSGATPSVWREVAPNTDVRFFVRGLDARNMALTDWAKSQAFRLQTLDTRLSTDGWQTASVERAYNGTIAYNPSSSASRLTYTVDGFAMAIVGPRSPNGGIANVYVDGRSAGTVSWKGAQQAGVLLFSWMWLADGRHKVDLEPVLGRIHLDALLVLKQN
jgi:hypothetical protein